MTCSCTRTTDRSQAPSSRRSEEAYDALVRAMVIDLNMA